MIYRLLTRKDRPQAQELWELAFKEDADGFARWYFDRRYLPEYSAGCFQGDRLLSVIHGTPMKLRMKMGWCIALMTSGVATLPGFEGRGLMHTNMLFLREQMQKRGIELLFNHPQRQGAYARLGFRPCSDTLYYQGVGNSPLPEEYSFAPFQADEALRLYQQVMEGYRGSVYRDKAAFMLKLEEYEQDGVKGVLLLKEGVPMGYALYSGEVCLQTAELLCLRKEAYGPFLCALPHSRVKAKLPPDILLPGEIKTQNIMLAGTEAWEAYGYEKGVCYCVEEF